MLGNDTHVRAMKIISNDFLHVTNMYVLQLLIRENIGHACIFIVHDGGGTTHQMFTLSDQKGQISAVANKPWESHLRAKIGNLQVSNVHPLQI